MRLEGEEREEEKAGNSGHYVLPAMPKGRPHTRHGPKRTLP